MSWMKEILSRELPKWPQMRVFGNTVRLEQAKEIIRRTDDFFSLASCNDKPFIDKWVKEFGWRNDFTDDEFRCKWGCLDLEHFSTSWIASACISGPNGWIHPNGTIRYDRNIGKWPSGGEVYNNLKQLAKAFPYLQMSVMVMDGEYCEVSPKPVMGFEVIGGIVSVTDPLIGYPKEFDMLDGGDNDTTMQRNLSMIFSCPVSVREHNTTAVGWLDEWAARSREIMA